MAVSGKPVDDFFQSGFGLAEGYFNDDKQLFLVSPRDPGMHYWFYDGDLDHRFDSVRRQGNAWICRRSIANILLPRHRVPTKIEELPGKNLYVAAVIGQSRVGGPLDERQRQALKMTFK